MAKLRRCIGSARFGIEPHDAPPTDFPAQPSRKDGLGRMCKPHWNRYTAGLARDAKARKAADGANVVAEPAKEAAKPEPIQTRVRASHRKASKPAAEEAGTPS